MRFCGSEKEKQVDSVKKAWGRCHKQIMEQPGFVELK